MTPSFNASENCSNESSSLQDEACDVLLRNSFPVTITKIILYSIILLSSLVGNALIISIVHKREELRNTINYFIVNMAVSDLIFPLTTIPEHLTQLASSSQEWHIDGTTGLIFCKLRWFLQNVSITVSVESLVWIALDRFVAVVLPMKVHFISSRFRIFALGFTWVVAVTGNSLLLFEFRLVEIDGDMFCLPLDVTSLSFVVYLRVYTVLFQILPVVVMTILYIVIAMTLRRQDKALQSRAVHQNDQRKRRAIKMSFCIMTTFYICTLPMLLAVLFTQYGVTISCTFSKALWFLSNLTLFLSSAVNPVICVAFIQSYRLGLKEICRSCWNKRLTTSIMARGEQRGITLQDIRIISWTSQNLAYID